MENMDTMWIAESIFGKARKESIEDFFTQPFLLTNNKPDYVVFVARRCFNLFWAFYDTLKQNINVNGRIMSNVGLLVKAKEIADYYLKNRAFPKILICDDSVFYGRGLARLLYNFEQLIIQHIDDSQQAHCSIYEQLNIHRDLIDVVDINVYAISEQRLLLDEDWLPKFHYFNRLSTSNLRELSQQISSFLTQSHIPNTSYTLSCVIKKSRKVIADQKWNYRGNEALLCFPYTLGNLIGSIRIHTDSNEQATYATGLVIWSDTPKKKIDTICLKLSLWISQYIDDHNISYILNSDKKQLQNPRMQLLALILSFFCFKKFRKDNNLSVRTMHKPDIDKICLNFAFNSASRNNLKKLFKQIVFSDIDFADLWQDINNVFDQEHFFNFDGTTNCYENDTKLAYNEAAEDIFYNLGMEAEKAAYNILQNGQKHYPYSKRTDKITINQYFEEMRKMGHCNDQDSMSAVLLMLDSGSVAFNNNIIEDEKGEYNNVCDLKAGELSTYHWPRRFYRFVPALALLEREFWRYSIDKPTTIKSFIKTIRLETESTESDKEVLKKLKNVADQWIDDIYAAGQSFNDWNVELRGLADRYEQLDNKTVNAYMHSISQDISLKEAYKQQAQVFLFRNE